MGEIQIGNVNINYTMPNILGDAATGELVDAGMTANWDRLPLLTTQYDSQKLQASDEIVIRSGVVVTCDVQHRAELENIEIGFVQSVTYSNRVAYFPFGARTHAIKVEETLDLPIKDGSGTPWYREDPPFGDDHPVLMCWDDEDVIGWTGTHASTLRLSDRPSFSFPKRITFEDEAITVAEAAHVEEFLVAFAVKHIGGGDHDADAMHYLYTVSWRVRSIVANGARVAMGAYTVFDRREIPVLQRGEKPADIRLDGPTANRTSKKRLVRAPI